MLMNKYQVNMMYSFQVVAENEEEAEEKTSDYIESEEGQGVRLNDMAIETEAIAGSCGNCSREIAVGENRCERCKGL